MTPPAFSSGMFDALREVLNIGVGRAAHALAELTGRTVSLRVLDIEFLDPGQPRVLPDLSGPLTLRISQAFGGALQGHALVAFNRSAAARLAQLLLGHVAADDEFDELEQSALLELGNIVAGAVAGALAAALDAPLHYELPRLQRRDVASLTDLFSDLADVRHSRVLVVHASLALRDEDLSVYLVLLYPESGFDALAARLARLAPR